MSTPAQYLTLGLDQEIFGIDIRAVREILDMRAISALPHAPVFLLGMIDVRGSSCPVVDLRLKLGMPAIEPTASTRIIILDIPLGGRLTAVGFVADRVIEVATVDDDRLEPPPEVGGQWRSHYIAGIGRKGAAFVVILDLDHLIGAEPLLEGAPAAVAA